MRLASFRRRLAKSILAFKRLHHGVEDRVDDGLRLTSRQLQRLGDFLDELGLGHP